MVIRFSAERGENAGHVARDVDTTRRKKEREGEREREREREKDRKERSVGNKRIQTGKANSAARNADSLSELYRIVSP